MKKILFFSCALLHVFGAYASLVSGSDVRKKLDDLKNEHNDSTALYSNMSLSDAKDKVKKWNRDFSWGNVNLGEITNNSSYHYKLMGPSGFDDVIIKKGESTKLNNASLSTGAYTLKPYRSIATTMFGDANLVDPLTSDASTAAEYSLAGGDITITPAGFDSHRGLLVAQTEKYDNQSSGVTIPARTHAIMVDMFTGGTPAIINLELNDLIITDAASGASQTVQRVMPKITEVNIDGINLFTAIVTKSKHVGDAADDVRKKLNDANIALEHSHFSSALVGVGQDVSVNEGQNSVGSLVTGGEGWLWNDIPAQSTTQYKIGRNGTKINFTTNFDSYVQENKKNNSWVTQVPTPY